MKFAHIADCHIGSWREPKLRDISTEAFVRAVDVSVENNVDFIIIAGDLFNTPLPSMDLLKRTVMKMKELQDKDVPIYIVAGSHDYSPSGKTMLDVLEGAGLVHNVLKGSVIDGKLKLRFTVDKRTGAKITGILGKRLGLEKTYYENLLKEGLEKEDGYKIFVFHSGIDEMKSKAMGNIESTPISFLPKNFSYYAGGHVHEKSVNRMDNYGVIAYPGPLFPNNFRELEELGVGGFFMVEDNIPRFIPIQVYNTFSISVDCSHKSPQAVQQEIMEKVRRNEFNKTIVLIRLAGKLASGKPSDMNFKEIYDAIYSKSAYFVMKNTSALSSEEYEEISIGASSIEDVEDAVIKEHIGQIKAGGLSKEKELGLIREMMEALSDQKMEGERVAEFEERVKRNVTRILNIED